MTIIKEAPPFPWLGEAILLLMVVLIRISRQREMPNPERAIPSDHKIAQVIQQFAKFIQLLEEYRRDNPALGDRYVPEAETLGQAADTRSVLNDITETPGPRPE